MRGSMRARLLKGLGANAFTQVTVAVIQLGGVPILLHYWAARMYGEWLILIAIPAYLSMTDLGFSQSAANDMTARLARGERKEALEVFQSLSALVFFSAGAGLLIVSAVVSVLPLDQWLNFGAMRSVEIRWVLWLLAAEVLVKLAEGISHAGFRANGDYPLIATLYSIGMLIQNAAIWFVAALGFGPVCAAAAFLFVRIAFAILEVFLLRRRHSWMQFGLIHARFIVLGQLLAPAFANLSMPFARALNLQGIVLVVGATLGPLAVVTFSALRTLTSVFALAAGGVSNTIEADLAAAYGTSNTALLRSLYLHSLRGGIWLIFGGMLALLSLGDWILMQWTHGEIAMDAPLFHWLLLTAAASVLSQSGLALLKASNRHLRTSLVCIATTGSAVVLSWALLHLTHHLALAGPCLFAMDLIFAAFALRAASALCGIGSIRSLVQALDPLPLIRLAYAPRRAP